MIDRNSRNQLCKLIRSFANGEINTREFEEQAEKISNASQDEVIQEILNGMLWDDFIEVSNTSISRSEIQWFNRLLLLLESDCEIDSLHGERNWAWSHKIALLALTFYILTTSFYGWGLWHITAMPFGIILGIFIYWQAHSQPTDIDATEGTKEGIEDSYPFPDLKSMFKVRRQITTFKKIPLPAIRSKSLYDKTSAFITKALTPGFNFLSFVAFVLFCSILSPLILLFLAIPFRSSETVFKIPKESL